MSILYDLYDQTGRIALFKDRKYSFIIGGDSLIGSHLYKEMVVRGKPVIITSRKKDDLKNHSVYLDLADSFEDWQIPPEIHSAFFCAAVTSIDFCNKYKKKSENINVKQTIRLIRKLDSFGISVHFLSSDQVFGTENEYSDESSHRSPQNEYGSQKSLVEDYIQTLDLNHSIIRMTKVIHPQFNLFEKWVSKLKQGAVICPFTDYYFSPISADFLTDMLIKIHEYGNGGTWHISGNRDISYYDAAVIIARTIGADPDLVQGQKRQNVDGIKKRAKKTALKCQRLISDLLIKPPDVEMTISETIRQMS